MGMGAGCRNCSLASMPIPRPAHRCGVGEGGPPAFARGAQGHYWLFFRGGTVGGFEVLDQHALALVEQLLRFASLPEEIGAKSRWWFR